ncbi:hypothetical protein ACFL35_01185 [Candidatus Riflebacteria bacterium]
MSISNYSEDSDNLIKIEITSFLEDFFYSFSLVSFAGFWPILIFSISDGRLSDPIFLFILGFCLIGFIICLICHLNIDDFYLADTQEKELFYHRCLLGYTSISKIVDFDDILAISITSQKRTHTRSYSVWWVYRIVLATKMGKVFHISDYGDGLEECNKQAEHLSSLMGVPYIPGEERRALYLERDEEGHYHIQFKIPLWNYLYW